VRQVLLIFGEFNVASLLILQIGGFRVSEAVSGRIDKSRFWEAVGADLFSAQDTEESRCAP
jgi:hypothetical protein